MTLFEYHTRKVPAYYKGMYQDGYSPEQILHALRSQMLQSHDEHQEEAEQSQVWNINIVSEVKKR